jgi:hypothetical protein
MSQQLTYENDPRKQRLMQWLMTFPKSERVPSSRKQLAAELGVAEKTMSGWQASADFKDMHKKLIAERQGSPEKLDFMVNTLEQIVEAQGQNAVPALRLWMEYGGYIVAGNKKELSNKPGGPRSAADLSDEELERIAQQRAVDELEKRRQVKAV